jgi:hypothetical protein
MVAKLLNEEITRIVLIDESSPKRMPKQPACEDGAAFFSTTYLVVFVLDKAYESKIQLVE